METLRYSVLFLTLICMSIHYANIVLFNFTVICMEPQDKSNNNTKAFTPVEEGWILSMVSVGGIVGTFPSIYITSQIGLRMSFTLSGYVSAIATVLMPLASVNFYWILVVRFVQGFAMAFANLACGAVPVTWGKATLRALFVSILTCSYQIGPMTAMLNAGYMCTSSFGWMAVYYLYGIITVVFFTVFFVVYSNTPHKNWMASKKVAPISESDAPKLSQKNQHIPYRRMFQTPSVWGIIISTFANCVGYEMYLLYGPIFVDTVIKTDVQLTGILAALPYFIAMVVKPITGIFLDKATCISDYMRYIVFIGMIAVVGCVTLPALTLTTSDMTCLSIALLLNATTLSIQHVGLMGVVADQYTHVLTSIIAAQNSAVGLVLPAVIAFFVPHYARSEWTAVFYGICVVIIVANVVFIAFTKARKAKFAHVTCQANSSEALKKISSSVL
ncbi:hypothetical protein QR680_010598 [Steinernema hermaphroditum]|uniref:Major facilitator superfamily (MFS) profile domain-containing protein n=1 Tax=Steinernema hermaphroditum TaxID=289476 RepID=A0AA39IPJ2_9BILA|nr:hypothetical protein QR680_010598 [Steinernema hermaphroditum]